MTKEEIKEHQDNLISLVPSDIRKSKELSKADKILLGQLVYLFGMDKAKGNGYVFRSNADLKEDTQLCKRSVDKAISHLTQLGVVNRNVGSREEGASVYTLNFELPQICKSSPKSSPITPKVAPKVALSNRPDMSADEVEAMIEGLRAEFQQQINDLRNEIAELKGLKLDEATAKVALKSSPNDGISSPKSSPQIQNSEKESTNHSVTSSNPDMGLPICAKEPTYIAIGGSNPDGGGNNPKADEGDKAIFNKIEGNDPAEVEQSQPEKANNGGATDKKINNPNDEEVNKSQATANKASGSVATPQTVQTTTNEEKTRQNANEGANPVSGNTYLNAEERINQLDALQLWKRNTPNVNPIELAKEVGELLVHDDILYQSHAYHKAEKIGCYLTLYANDLDTLNQIETALTSGHIKEYGTSTRNLDDAFAIQRNYLSNPQPLENSSEPHQSHAEQSDKETITNEQKRAQNRPDEAGEGLQVDKTIDALLTKLANLNAQFGTGDHEAAQKAEKWMNKVCKCCGETDSIGVLNWCALNIPTMLEKHGRVLGTNVNLYLSVIPNVIANRRKELLAA